MQAFLSAHAVKPLIKALTALSKYGEDLDIHATPEHLALSSTNSSKSAYGRFRLLPSFFERYQINVKPEPRFSKLNTQAENDVQEIEMAAGQILTKSVLSILRHRGLEKTLERCEIAILPGREASQLHASGTTTSSADDSATSVLLIRLHCQHGVKKTHRLDLNAPPPLLAPNLPSSASQCQVVIGPKAVKDLVEHFNLTKGKGSKTSELQLIWDWRADDVQVRSLRSLLGTSSDTQIATSITVEAEEFDEYSIPIPPVCLSFHLREFLAATSLAEGLSLQLALSFSEPGNPFCITIESDSHESLFVLCTRQPPNQANAPPDPFEAQRKKRARTEEETREQPPKKPMKVVVPADTGSPQPRSVRSSGLQFKAPLPRDTTPVAGPSNAGSNRLPLFHPSTPQQRRQEEHFIPLSQADRNVLKGTGLEDMTSEEIAAMMDADDDEDNDMTGPTAKESVARTGSPSFRWSPTPAPATQAREQALARAPILPPSNSADFDDAERMEMELDPDAEEDQLDGESYVPATQIPRQSGHKIFRPLDFGDD